MQDIRKNQRQIQVVKPYLILKTEPHHKLIGLLRFGEGQIEQGQHIILFCHNCHKSLQKQIIIVIKEQDRNPHKKRMKKEKIHNIDVNKNLCVGCFLDQIKEELQLQLRYCVHSKLQFPIMVQNWSTYSEISFLNALEKYGNNWEQIEMEMKYFGSDLRAEQMHMHYQINYYRDGYPSLMIAPKLLESRRQNLNDRKNPRKSPYSFRSNTVSRSPDEDEDQNDQLFQIYERVALQIILKNEEPLLQDYIENLQFETKDNLSVMEIKQQQIKFQIIQVYEKCLRQRYSKLRMMMTFQPFKLLKIKNNQKGGTAMNAVFKDPLTFYSDLFNFQHQKEQKNTLRYLKKGICLTTQLLKYLTKEQFEEVTKAVTFCLQFKQLIDALQVLFKNHRKIKKPKVKSYFNFLFHEKSSKKASTKQLSQQKGLQEEEYIQSSQPRKRIHRDPHQQVQRRKKLAQQLGFENEEKIMMFCSQYLGGANDKSKSPEIQVIKLSR